MATETSVTPETTKKEGKVVENVVEDTIIEAEEQNFTLAINFPHFPGKTYVMEEGITQDCDLDLVEDPYTEREARIHVIHVRELLAGPFKQSTSSVGIDPGLSFFTAVTGINAEENGKSKEDSEVPKTPFTDYDFTAPSLSKFIPDNFGRHKIKCVESLYLSGWNPVPFERRRRGDLLYLIVTTIEGETLHITAGVDGFFVNRSTIKNFDFNPRTELQLYHAHSLITLLQGLSPSFRTNFKILQDFIGAHHPFETIPVNTCFPAYPWIARQSKHIYDMGRATEIYLNFGMDAVDSLRDWNDEFQSQREYPRVELRDRVLRERLINKIQADFTESAVKGAIAVINGTFSKLGGNDAAHVATGKDMEGIRTVNSIDVEGLYTLGCVVIDYKGVRIVAQTIVPGIFRRQDDSSIVYGYFDNGRDDPKLCANAEFHEIVGKAAKALHLEEHSVCDAKGTTVKLYTSLETKGLMGDDGRRYLFDLYRLNPVDIEFIEKECELKEGSDIPIYPHRLALLRPELIESYWDYRFRLWLQDKAKEKEAGDSTKEATITESDEFNLAFNPDAFTNFNTPTGDEHAARKAADEENVRNASKYLRDTVIRINKNLEYDYLTLTPSSLCQQIRETVLIRYRYRLPEDFINVHVRKLPLLREICLRVGVQIAAQGYNFLKKKSKKRVTTFVPDDILNLIPTIKQATPKVKLGGTLRLKYMRHAMYYWEIIFGNLHPDGATADHNVGIMLQNMKDYEGSIKFFERAKNTNEFVFGKNNVVTGESYHLLAKALAYAEDYKAALIAE
ncbi:5293_t:CDS:10, partial [Racocetra fulgida]